MIERYLKRITVFGMWLSPVVIDGAKAPAAILAEDTDRKAPANEAVLARCRIENVK